MVKEEQLKQFGGYGNISFLFLMAFNVASAANAFDIFLLEARQFYSDSGMFNALNVASMASDYTGIACLKVFSERRKVKQLGYLSIIANGVKVRIAQTMNIKPFRAIAIESQVYAGASDGMVKIEAVNQERSAVHKKLNPPSRGPEGPGELCSYSGVDLNGNYNSVIVAVNEIISLETK